jgi:hypothetical protein
LNKSASKEFIEESPDINQYLAQNNQMSTHQKDLLANNRQTNEAIVGEFEKD